MLRRPHATSRLAALLAAAIVCPATAQTLPPSRDAEPAFTLRGTVSPPDRSTRQRQTPSADTIQAPQPPLKPRKPDRRVVAETRPEPLVAPPPPPPPRPKRKVAEDPYAPLGLRAGNVLVFPSVEQSIGYDDNPNRESGRKRGSFVSRSEAEIKAQSDWAVHDLKAELRGGYSVYPNVSGADRPDAQGKIQLRLDATRHSSIDIDGKFQVDTQRPGSPDLNAPVVERPLVASGGAGLGGTQRFGRFQIGLRAGAERSAYEDGKLPDGTIVEQGDRDFNEYNLRLRAGYEVTPGLVPFLEGQVDTREHDRRVDLAGFRRDSEGFSVKAGTTFELSRILTGEAALGYGDRDFEDPRLRNLRGPIADASLIWEATPLTTVRLRGEIRMEETTVTNSSGIMASRASIEVKHDLRRNLSVTGVASISESDYKGVALTERGYSVGARLEYKLAPSVVVKSSFTHERLDSSSPGSDYTANVYLVGLRFQL